MESTADGGGQPDMIWVLSVSVRQKLAQVGPILQSLHWIKTDFHHKAFWFIVLFPSIKDFLMVTTFNFLLQEWS